MSDVVWKDWNPQRVKAQVAKQLAENMEAVCAVVEQRARVNLIAIEEPKQWKSYRRKFLTHWLTHEIETTPDLVEGRIGISRKSGYERGGYYIETGRRKLPAHPWMRPAVFNNAREILKLLAGK